VSAAASLLAEGVLLRFVVHEKQRADGQILHDWLLLSARKLGLPGGLAVRGVAGYGHGGALLEEHFFELAADMPLEVSFVCSADQAGQLLDAVTAAGLSLFHSITPARFGRTGAAPAGAGESPEH
jgi:PII-like signaling protein